MGDGSAGSIAPLLQLQPRFFTHNVASVAQDLIGTMLLVNGVGGVIVETEAYDALDPASHSFGGQTARNAAMFGAPGTAYVYRSYGLHWCLNFVTGVPGEGSAVLIRALEPVYGIDEMIRRRGLDQQRLLCAGPGRLSQALGIDKSLNGAPLDQSPFNLLAGDSLIPIGCGPRIGISTAVDAPWRFFAMESAFLSRPSSREPPEPGRQ